MKEKKPPKAKNVPQLKRPSKPRKRFVTDQDGTLGIAKSIASRFGEEIGEEDFFDK